MPMMQRLPTLCLLTLVAVLGACGRAPDRETAVRAVLEAAEAAAEARDVGAAIELVSADYGDAAGRDRAALRAVVRGWFALNPRIELLVTVQGIEFPEANRARVQLLVASVSRGAGFSVDGDRFVVELVDEDGNWRLLRSSRARD
jgi:NAD(P)-dependent dehydrogenase (short-subunit alcohol dehydrogenase family)